MAKFVIVVVLLALIGVIIAIVYNNEKWERDADRRLDGVRHLMCVAAKNIDDGDDSRVE